MSEEHFHNEAKASEYVEKLIWPEVSVCRIARKPLGRRCIIEIDETFARQKGKVAKRGSAHKRAVLMDRKGEAKL